MSTVETFEKSSSLAVPIELYVFSIGGQQYFFTSRSRDFLALDGNVYKSARIKREKVRRSGDFRKESLSLTVPRDFLISESFKTPIPGAPIELQIFRTHKGASNQDFLWSGRVVSCTFSDASSSLECQSHGSIVEKYAVRKSFQRTCSNDLYGFGCKVNKSNFTTIKNISSVSENGLTINSDDFTEEAGFFVGGFAQVGEAYRAIIQYNPVEKFIVISAPIEGLESGEITLAAGCDKSLGTCTNRFNNAINFLGFIHMPKENPFEKDIS